LETPALGLYVVASLALIATPGQDMVYVITRSLAQGRAAGIASAVGVCIGILVHTALAALGVGALLAAHENLFTAVKIGGCVYLAWLGLRMLVAPSPQAPREIAMPAANLGTVLAQGTLSNVTNPKILLFFVAFLPQFVDPASAHPTRDLASLGVLYAVLALPVKSGVALAASSLAGPLLRHPRARARLDRACGTVMLLLAARLALQER